MTYTYNNKGTCSVRTDSECIRQQQGCNHYLDRF